MTGRRDDNLLNMVVVGDFSRIGLTQASPTLQAIVSIGDDNGSGWLAMPDRAVTASHCIPAGQSTQIIYDAFQNSRIARVFHYPAGSDGSNDDIAVLVFSSPFTTQPLGFGGVESDSVPGSTVEVAGRCDGRLGDIVWFDGKVAALSDGMLFYAVNTLQGHSGSPVFIIPMVDAAAPSRVIGVHLGGGVGAPAGLNNVNRGAFIDADRQAFIRNPT
ncbi:trypsin-like serine peptidase [Burkholderia cepacia]|uniref:trypsin-like serine peptidase n=1 Tax=Burkholderia cepacia TaxID=292 RepID=UPI000AB43A04|nr:trypsin-like peptidase domain-containing protein [Burkholderia cepacia]